MNYTVVFVILMFSTSFSFFPVNCKVYFGIPSFKSPPKRRGGVGHTTNFHTGRLGPYLQARTDTIFTQKWYSFHIPCLELCTLFTCCKCTVISIGIHDKNRTFSQLYKTMKFIGSTYDRFSYVFTNFKSQIRNLSYTRRLKKLPFWSGASPCKPL